MPHLTEVEIPAAERYTREDLETALAMVGEWNAHPGAEPRSLTVSDVDAAVALAGCARIIHRVAENECNGYRVEADEIADAKRHKRAFEKARCILDQVGLPWVTVTTGGDPRGACFFLHFGETKRHNTWGGESSGWAVS